MGMKMALAALLLLSLASAGRAEEAAAPAPAPAAGKLEAPEVEYDAGKVERGVRLRHTFVLKNSGTAELAIDAKPG